jgi:hypothetical protein
MELANFAIGKGGSGFEPRTADSAYCSVRGTATLNIVHRRELVNKLFAGNSQSSILADPVLLRRRVTVETPRIV